MRRLQGQNSEKALNFTVFAPPRCTGLELFNINSHSACSRFAADSCYEVSHFLFSCLRPLYAFLMNLYRLSLENLVVLCFNGTTCVLTLYLLLQVIGSGHEYHFIQRALPHARTKRSVLHTRQLKTDPSVSSSLTTNSGYLVSPFPRAEL